MGRVSLSSSSFSPWQMLSGARLGSLRATLSFFGHLHGRVDALIAWVAIVWVAAAFAEELVVRGWLMRRIAEGLGGPQGA